MDADIDSGTIAKFCTVTNGDPQAAKHYLTVCDGDLERAIMLFLETGGADLSSTLPPPRSTTNAPNTGETSSADVSALSSDRDYAASTLQKDAELARQLAAENESVRAPIAPKREVLLGDDANQTMEFIPHNEHIPRPRPPPREPTVRPINAFVDTTSPRTSRPTDTHFGGLAELFAPPIDIMEVGDFDLVRNVARTTGKWMMINIQKSDVFGCQVLNRDLWRDQTVKDVIRADFLFMQLSSESKEGKRYLNFYPVNNYPHIAIIDPRTGERVKELNYQVAPNEFIVAVTDFLESYSLTETSGKSAPAVQELPRATKGSVAMSEEEQIQAALAESQQTMDKPSNPRAPSTEDPEEATDDESPGMSAFDTIHPVERPEPAEGPETTKIQFRFADGSKKIRRFAKSDPVRHLFEYVKATVEAARDQPFELVYNRKQLIDQIEQTVAEAELLNANVSVGVQ